MIEWTRDTTVTDIVAFFASNVNNVNGILSLEQKKKAMT